MGSSTKKGRGDHPALGLLQAFLDARESQDDGLAVRRHLTDRRCLRCLLALNRLVAAGRESHASMVVDALRAGRGAEERRELVRQVAVRTERRAWLRAVEDQIAPDLLQELLLRPQKARRQAVRSLGRYQLLGLADQVIGRTRSEVFEDVARAAELGGLAVDVAENLPTEVYGAREVATAEARAWGALGNALRVRGELREAERALTMARDLLETKGHGAEVERAEVLSFAGSLRMSQARFDEAQEILEEAAVLYAKQGEIKSQARTLVKLGKALGEGGRPEEAVVVLERVEDLIADQGRTTLRLFARQLRSMCLNEAGRTQEARELLELLRPDWMAQLPQFSHQQRLTWLEARILWSEGDLAAAAELFLKVQRGWEERDEAYEYALVSLELAALYLEQGRTAEVRDLAERMLPIFQSQEIHHHAMAALVLVQRAVANNTVTAAFVRDVLHYLHRARSNPEFAYSPQS